tara:strand:+ start:20313 stop:20462 length:150 start_codon:yes stop_codon:yes gene_type:complete
VWGLSLIEDCDYLIKGVVLWSEKINDQNPNGQKHFPKGFRKIVGQVAAK